jgi:hypothetical protein
MRRVLLVLGILASGCATTGLPRCPREGGPAWRAVESEHFVVYTDGSSEKAADIARDLEFTRAALAHFMVRGWKGPPGRIPVVALQGKAHFEAFFPPEIHGLYAEILLEPVVLMKGASPLDSQTLIKHELNHYVVDAYISLGNLPRWVSEGLATFSETLRIDRERGQVTVGKTDDERVLFALARYDPKRLHWELTQRLRDHAEDSFYGTSWFKVHYLLYHHGSSFSRFLHALSQGREEREAWAASFPDLPYDQLDVHLTRYATTGQYREVTLPMPVPEVELTERSVDDADVHVWRAVLYLLSKKNGGPNAKGAEQLGRVEVAEALRQDPAHPRALAAEVMLGSDVGLERARAATLAYPDSWIAWYLLHDAQRRAGNAAAAATAYEQAKRRAAGNPAVRFERKRSGH